MENLVHVTWRWWWKVAWSVGLLWNQSRVNLTVKQRTCTKLRRFSSQCSLLMKKWQYTLMYCKKIWARRIMGKWKRNGTKDTSSHTLHWNHQMHATLWCVDYTMLWTPPKTMVTQYHQFWKKHGTGRQLFHLEILKTYLAQITACVRFSFSITTLKMKMLVLSRKQLRHCLDTKDISCNMGKSISRSSSSTTLSWSNF